MRSTRWPMPAEWYRGIGWLMSRPWQPPATEPADSGGTVARARRRSAPSRVWPSGPPARPPHTAPQTGRYPKPVPRSVRRSARWYGPTVLVLLVGGVLVVVLNYLTVLPGAVSVWYLIGGIRALFTGFLMATRYR